MIEANRSTGAVQPRPSSARHRGFSWVAAVVCFVVLAAFVISRTWPPLPATLRFAITLPASHPGHIEPIIATGEFSNGDFLVIRYETPDRAVFAYDAWGEGGPASEPVTCIAGSTHRMEVEMPALTELPGVSNRLKAPLRVSFDGRTILAASVSFHRRESGEVYFGSNPLGGTPEPLFRGKLTTPNGHRLIGGPESYFSWWRRARGVLANVPRTLTLVLIALLAGYAVPFAVGFLRRRPRSAEAPAASVPPRRIFLTILAIAVVGFVYLITDGSFRLFYPESFGNFYDYQALSLVHGRLDVPEAALSGEAFVYHGKYYGYFGPTPALLRIPFVMLGVGFGELSRPMMVLDYIACLLGCYFILCQVVRMRNGPAAWPSRWTTGVLIASAGLGSTIFYLSSRAYIYHEAILCGVAFTVWAAYLTLRYLENPGGRWWIGALVCGTLAVHARPPIGFFALCFVGTAAAVTIVDSWLNRRRAAIAGAASATAPARHQTAPGVTRHFVIGILAVAGVLSFNGLSYLKFGTIEGCPLRYNVQYSPERLARIDGKEFHLSNIRFGLDAYLLRPTLQVSRHFPYFATHGLDSRTYPEAKLDMTEEMAGLPYAMPSLFFLALVSVCVWTERNRVLSRAWIAVWAAVVPPALAMFAAIAVSERYTADFVGFLIVAAAIGLAVIERPRGRIAGATRGLAATLTALSIAITLALTYSYQGKGVWGVPDGTQEKYQAVAHRVDAFFGVKP